MAGQGPDNLSLLERRAVGLATEKMYVKEYEEFMTFARPRGLNLDHAEKVDALLVEFMNLQFLSGHQAYKGDRLIASWMHHRVMFSKVGAKRIPRALRALKGWRRLCPGRSRTPYPLAVWCGMAALMKEMGHPMMSIFAMLPLPRRFFE